MENAYVVILRFYMLCKLHSLSSSEMTIKMKNAPKAQKIYTFDLENRL